MTLLGGIRLLMIIAWLGPTKAADNECIDTKFILSKCYKNQTYQWLIEVPTTSNICLGKTIAEPKSIPCNFVCPRGMALDTATLKCKTCPSGTFSLQGGHQYTFDESKGLNAVPDLSLKASSLVASNQNQCKKANLWSVKGNALQGEVKPDCALELELQFKLERPGSVTVTYNLATSYVFGVITSRCDFTTNNRDETDAIDLDNDMKRSVDFKLTATGYGSWKDEKISISAAGDYTFSLYAVGLDSFHFPFSIRSIVVEGSLYLQECIPCPAGTFAPKAGSANCTTCPANSFSSDSGSAECTRCDRKTEYAEEGSTQCSQRPPCQSKDYQKVFKGCDSSNMATFKYEPIQPKICVNDIVFPEPEKLPCRSCNPGTFKNKATGKCDFCPARTYSDGTSDICSPCSSDLSLVPGLYFKNWNGLPTYLNGSYISFDKSRSSTDLLDDQSWIPSIAYISSQAIPDTLSALSLTIVKGFRRTELTKLTKEYGTLYFKFSIQCQSRCSLVLIAQDIYNDDADDDWNILHKWHFDPKTEHKEVVEFKYSIPFWNEMIFSWLFSSDPVEQGADEVRIYEISVTNTVDGGSDRCVSCLTADNRETECKACSPGHILVNSTCLRCPPFTVAARQRPHDPVATVCSPCPNNTISDDGISCYVPCLHKFNGNIQYDLSGISSAVFRGSKLFTQKGSGYFHLFNASICGNTTSVTCAKTLTSSDTKTPFNQMQIDSKLCRMSIVPDKNDNITYVASVDEFGEQMVNVSQWTSTYFPAFRSDYALADIMLVYRVNVSDSQSICPERITYLSLRCDHSIDNGKKPFTSGVHTVQAPADCATGTCDGCTFHFLLRTPLACPSCDEISNGFRTFLGPCKFGKQEVRKIPYQYCLHNLTEKFETRRCSMFTIEIEILVGVFILLFIVLLGMVIVCWRKNRKLEYRYMQLAENVNPDDDLPVDNVCAQISDEEDSGEEVHFKSQSRTKNLMNAVRKVIQKNPTNGRSESHGRDSFLLESRLTNDA